MSTLKLEANVTTAMFERHFSPQTLAEMWNVSADTIYRWFENEPGVIRFGEEGARGRRRRISMRIPESVALRVYRERVKVN